MIKPTTTFKVSTQDGVSLALSNIARQLPFESKLSAEFRFRKNVGEAKNKLKALNQNSFLNWEQVDENKFEAKDFLGNIKYLYIL